MGDEGLVEGEERCWRAKWRSQWRWKQLMWVAAVEAVDVGGDVDVGVEMSSIGGGRNRRGRGWR